MQISETSLFVFVEGTTDRWFYEEIVGEAAATALVIHEVWSAEDVVGTSGGKTQLIGLYESQSNLGPLLDDFKGKRTALVFYFDKDVDDLKDSMLESPHVVYTEHYHMENYVCMHGDMVAAVAAAASLSKKAVRAVIGEPDSWRTAAAWLWQDWVKLCVVAQLYDLGCGCTYRIRSAVNQGQFGQVNVTQFDTLFRALETAFGQGTTAFSAIYARVNSMVDELYGEGRHDSVFKGEWYLDFLIDAAGKASAGLKVIEVGMRDRLKGSLSESLDFTQGWTMNLRTPVESLLVQL